jgi:hydrogenase-4 component B
LFLSAGGVVRAAGTREIERLGGLARSLPWSAALFTLGAVAICGLPPLNGFMSEFILLMGALRGLQTENAGWVTFAAPILALIATLALACFVKVVGTVFLGLPRTDSRHLARECDWWMRGPMLVLAALCVALGVAPALVARALDSAAGAWIGTWTGVLPPLAGAVPFGPLATSVIGMSVAAGAACVALGGAARGRRTTGTWDCGYLQPGPRMQYTGSSMARGLVGLFQFVVRAREHDPAIRDAMPARSVYHGHVGDVVLERWVVPFVRWCAEGCIRVRQRQSARIQTYITYVVAATLVLLLLGVPLVQLLRRIVTQ